MSDPLSDHPHKAASMSRRQIIKRPEHSVGHPADLDEEANAAVRRELFGSIDRFLVKFYGERCSVVQGGCPCCAVWAARDALNASIFE